MNLCLFMLKKVSADTAGRRVFLPVWDAKECKNKKATKSDARGNWVGRGQAQYYRSKKKVLGVKVGGGSLTLSVGGGIPTNYAVCWPKSKKVSLFQQTKNSGNLTVVPPPPPIFFFWASGRCQF